MKRAAALGFLLFATTAFAGFDGASRGTTAASFLTLGAGARAAAMGTAQTAAAEGAFALGWNPAGLAVTHAYQLDVMRADWFDSAAYNVAAAAIPVGPSQVLGVAAQQYTVGDLTRRDTAGFDQGTFQPQDTAVTLGWAREAGDGYHWGVAGKYIQSKIVDSAATGAVDLGVVSSEDHGHRWGASVQNLGGTIKYDQAKEPLPILIAVGGTQKLKRLLFAGDVKFPRDNNPYAALGIEGSLPVGGGWQGLGRVGYSTRSLAAPGGLAGFSTGAGLRAPWFSLDYAFAPFGDLGSVQFFSVSIYGGGRAADRP